MLQMACFNRRRLLATTANFARCVAGGSVIVFTLTGCAAPFSEMQSARLAGVHRAEITPTFTAVRASVEDGGTAALQSQLGVHAAYGVSENVDIRLRFERITLDESGGAEGNTNILAIGPKLAIKRDIVAVYLPVGFAFGGGIESSNTIQVHPTLLLTAPVTSRVDVNGSVKALVPVGEDYDRLVAYNIGLGISSTDRVWTVRPEFGVLRKPNEIGHARHFSIGLTRGFGQKHQPL